MDIHEAAEIVYGKRNKNRRADTYEYTKQYGIRVELTYNPAFEEVVTPGHNEPKGEPYIEHTDPEVCSVRYYFETEEGEDLEVKEKDLPEGVVDYIIENVFLDLDNQGERI